MKNTRKCRCTKHERSANVQQSQLRRADTEWSTDVSVGKGIPTAEAGRDDREPRAIIGKESFFECVKRRRGERTASTSRCHRRRLRERSDGERGKRRRDGDGARVTPLIHQRGSAADTREPRRADTPPPLRLPGRLARRVRRPTARRPLWIYQPVSAVTPYISASAKMSLLRSVLISEFD
ncbi:hypothetical protein SKAU_G00126360 [Synaphobranchus kaupii]|uniref:Uncharacterized protein n=1 Tax=Synaphobranchus kaupii TaxID=118154 RepID=A0A9Q1FPI5_SYNKA|nr:hypothetical protein SKAU_G00126360 [Synaphobranchus kaupii]